MGKVHEVHAPRADVTAVPVPPVLCILAEQANLRRPAHVSAVNKEHQNNVNYTKAVKAVLGINQPSTSRGLSNIIVSVDGSTCEIEPGTMSRFNDRHRKCIVDLLVENHRRHGYEGSQIKIVVLYVAQGLSSEPTRLVVVEGIFCPHRYQYSHLFVYIFLAWPSASSIFLHISALSILPCILANLPDLLCSSPYSSLSFSHPCFFGNHFHSSQL